MTYVVYFMLSLSTQKDSWCLNFSLISTFGVWPKMEDIQEKSDNMTSKINVCVCGGGKMFVLNITQKEELYFI